MMRERRGILAGGLMILCVVLLIAATSDRNVTIGWDDTPSIQQLTFENEVSSDGIHVATTTIPVYIGSVRAGYFSSAGIVLDKDITVNGGDLDVTSSSGESVIDQSAPDAIRNRFYLNNDLLWQLNTNNISNGAFFYGINTPVVTCFRRPTRI